MELNPSLIDVNNSAACSRSPMMYSQDCAHPDCTDSFIVSISCVNVFTCVAAFKRVSSSANFSNVLTSTSEVSQLSCPPAALIDSLKLTDSSTTIPICFAVSFSAFWNSSPPMPAFTTEFQSCKLTRPAAIACDN